MKTTRIQVKRSNPCVAAILKAAHPEYKGRKVAIEMVPLGTPISRDPADGGTFSRLALVSLERTLAATQIDPTRAQAVYGPAVFGLLVAWDHCQGADCGVTIYIPMIDAFDVVVDALLPGPNGRATEILESEIAGSWGKKGAPQTRDLYMTACVERANHLRAAEKAA